MRGLNQIENHCHNNLQPASSASPAVILIHSGLSVILAISAAIGISMLAAIMMLPQSAALANERMNQGIKAYNAGNYSKAAGLFGEAETTEFNNPELHYYLANSLAKMNQTQDAIKEYKVALAMQPTGQMADFCHAALIALGAEQRPVAPVKAPLSKASSLPPAAKEDAGDAAAMEPARIIGMFCGCPLCRRLQVILDEVGRQFAGKIQVSTMDYNDNAAQSGKGMIGRYGRGCPTLVFMDHNKQVVRIGDGTISQQLVFDTANNIAESPVSDNDSQGGNARSESISMEAQARILDNQKLLDEEIRRINERLQADIADIRSYQIRNRNSYYMQQQIDDLQQQAKTRIDNLKKDFDRKQREILDSVH